MERGEQSDPGGRTKGQGGKKQSVRGGNEGHGVVKRGAGGREQLVV